jgi:hypothetical protein
VWLPGGFECRFDHMLTDPVRNGRDPQGPQFAACLGNVCPSDRPGAE